MYQPLSGGMEPHYVHPVQTAGTLLMSLKLHIYKHRYRCFISRLSLLCFIPYNILPGPLIDERDLYLAWTLKRSRAVCGQRRVVGVVGRGHLSGVMRAIAADRGGDALVSRIFRSLSPPGTGFGFRREVSK